MIRDNTLPDTRWVSLKWIQQNIPPGIRIGREHYTPQIELYSDMYYVTYLGINGVVLMQGMREPVDIMIASSDDYSRFVDHPDQYPLYADIYNIFLAVTSLSKNWSKMGRL